MKIAFFKHNNEKNYGVVKGSKIVPIVGDIFGEFEETADEIDLAEVELLPPVTPRKVICVGLNYALHAKESGLAVPDEPMLFMCSPAAIIGQNDSIRLSNYEDPIDYEAELVIVIKKEGKNISPENYKEYVLGYTCGNDVSNRYLQKKDGQFTRAKSFDTYKPLGPYIETDVEPNNLGIKLYQNGELKQSSNTNDMIFPIETIVHFVSSIMTLEPGDVIYTGTPEGIGNLKKGDKIEIEIEGIGRLVNYVE